MHEFVTYDPGPGFVGMSGRVGERIVCVVTSRVHTDPSVRRDARRLVRRQGGDCDTCEQLSCPLKRLA